uniref:Uncharacterized protein n=1 Tax=Anopheles dirus TaxID=7168 RepID=A0A182NYV7_9DIPT
MFELFRCPAFSSYWFSLRRFSGSTTCAYISFSLLALPFFRRCLKLIIFLILIVTVLSLQRFDQRAECTLSLEHYLLLQRCQFLLLYYLFSLLRFACVLLASAVTLRFWFFGKDSVFWNLLFVNHFLNNVGDTRFIFARHERDALHHVVFAAFTIHVSSLDVILLRLRANVVFLVIIDVLLGYGLEKLLPSSYPVGAGVVAIIDDATFVVYCAGIFVAEYVVKFAQYFKFFSCLLLIAFWNSIRMNL